MSTQIYIGQLNYFSDTVEEIVKIDSKYYLINPDTKEKAEIDKKVIQYFMTNPWDESGLNVSVEKENDIYIATYISIVYDLIIININASGKTHHEAMLGLSKNIIDIFEDYDEEVVKKYMERNGEE